MTTGRRGTVALITALLVVTPLVIVPDAKEAFRLPKLLVGGWLGIASLVAAACTLWHVDRVGLTPLLRAPAVRMLAPLFAVVLVSSWTTTHAVHAREAFADFAIGATCLIAWSLTLPSAVLRRVLDVTVALGSLVAVLVLDQASGALGLLDGLHVQAPTARLSLTSTLGNPGDVGAYLVLPLLLVVDACTARATSARGWYLAGGAVILAGLVATGTLAALGAATAGAAVMWWTRRGRTLTWRRLTVRVATVVVVLAVLVAAFAPLRDRAVTGAQAAGNLEVNRLLTGRLDGWRAAMRMWRTHLVTGVGHGAFRTEFAETRLALQSEGVTFLPEQHQVMFATPHNEVLSVAAETGLPGLLALAWAVWCLVRMTLAHTTDGAGLMRGGVAALAVLCLLWFPLHAAAIAWPWVTFVAWICRATREKAPA